MMRGEFRVQCENCKWWDNSVSLSDKEATGLCRNLPPRRDKRSGQAVWPFTEDVDWCAAFEIDPLANHDE
jgi:hypothetical protein